MAFFRTRMTSNSGAPVVVQLRLLSNIGKQKLKLQSMSVNVVDAGDVQLVAANWVIPRYHVTLQATNPGYGLNLSENGFLANIIMIPKLAVLATATRCLSVFDPFVKNNFKDIKTGTNPFIVLESVGVTNTFVDVEVEYTVSGMTDAEAALLAFQQT